MAREVVVHVLCDRCGAGDATAIELAVDDLKVEIDLCGDHRTELMKTLVPFMDAGRASRPQPRKTAEPGTAKARSTRHRPVRRDRAQTEAIRRWAKENGFAVSDRGRIPREAEEAYNKRTTR